MAPVAFYGTCVDTPKFGEIRGLDERTLLVVLDGVITSLHRGVAADEHRRRLEEDGTDVRLLEDSEVSHFWDYLGLSGIIWDHLGLFGKIIWYPRDWRCACWVLFYRLILKRWPSFATGRKRLWCSSLEPRCSWVFIEPVISKKPWLIFGYLENPICLFDLCGVHFKFAYNFTSKYKKHERQKTELYSATNANCEKLFRCCFPALLTPTSISRSSPSLAPGLTNPWWAKRDFSPAMPFQPKNPWRSWERPGQFTGWPWRLCWVMAPPRRWSLQAFILNLPKHWLILRSKNKAHERWWAKFALTDTVLTRTLKLPKHHWFWLKSVRRFWGFWHVLILMFQGFSEGGCC